ncbi:MAG: penicillin acylase family protein [Gammaproteobacteria bacterium]|nr:penicillin acylase family protein [Gammaproteobacteria bacterium]
MNLGYVCGLTLLLIHSVASYAVPLKEINVEVLQLPGLIAGVNLKIDEYGITHITAANNHDLFFAQGFNAARDRLWQIDFWRRSGLGELSLVFGEDFLAKDRASRLMLYRGSMNEEWQSYGADARTVTEAFVAGINAYVKLVKDKVRPLPLEFIELGYQPAFWQAEDVVRIRSHGVWQNVISEVERAFMICYGSIQGDLIRRKLEPEHEVELPTGFDPCSLPENVLDQYLLASYPPSFDPGQGGSNNWAIAGGRTSTGRPIVAADPHRAYTIPSLRYAVHLKSPDINIIGAGEPHAPGVAIGHNGRVAFGFTIFPADQEDLMVYDLNSKNPNQYQHQGQWHDMEIIQEKIPLRNNQSKTVELKYTRHGPVLYQDDKNAYALRTVALEPGTAPYLGQLSLARVKNVDEYDDALQRWGSPGEHHVFADIEGNIAWRSAAKTPIRTRHDGLLPVAGNGRFEWQGFHPSSSLPGAKNPENGWITTANNIIDAEHYPYSKKALSFEWVGDWRARRISEVLASNTKHSVFDSLLLQNDYTSVFARELTALLVEINFKNSGAKKSQKLFANWNHTFDPESNTAALFQIWYYGHLAPTLTKIVGGEIAESIVTLPDERTVLEVLRHPGDWLDGLAEGDSIDQRNAILEQTLSKAHRDLSLLFLFKSKDKKGWGELLTARWQHLAQPLLSEKLNKRFHLREVARGGDLTTPGMVVFNEEFDTLYGASWRVVMDVGEWDNSIFVNAPGQSGDPRSPHFADLYEVWAKNNAVPLLYSEAAIDRVVRKLIKLAPPPAK